ncbi:hypothetical protein niasHT_026718 [Heterodera trifolii]|uniref:Hexosyltransferase n=1 Tax=Heterodera trifolii TaxID=157864 RepID=A0ABD2JNH1_9BILA
MKLSRGSILLRSSFCGHIKHGSIVHDPMSHGSIVYDQTKHGSIRNGPIVRCISKKVFPAELFPPFVLGGFYLTNGATVQAVLAQTHKTDGFFLDDVLFAGILAGLANATISDQQRHITSYNRKLQFKCVHGVPTLFAMFNAAKRAQCEEFFAYLKKMLCKNNGKRNLITMISSLLIAISLIYAFLPFH